MTPNTSVQESSVRYDVSLLTAEDLYLFNEGSHYRIYEKMGAHVVKTKGVIGTIFGVWAPNARQVSVIGDFNGWSPQSHRLQARGSSGIWEGFIPGIEKGTLYKFHIDSNQQGYQIEKSDPVALFAEKPPKTASVVGISTMPGTIKGFLKIAPPPTPCTRRCRSMKSISARGCAIPKNTIAR